MTRFMIAVLLTFMSATTVNASNRTTDRQLYDATQQAINVYCTRTSLATSAEQATCTEAITTIVKGFAQQYAAQFQRNGAIAQNNQNFSAFADYNLKRNCLESDKSLNSAMQCIRSIHALENDQGQTGTLGDSNRQFSYDRTGVKTAFNQQLFDLISVGTICAYGTVHRAAAEQNICRAEGPAKGLKFRR